MVQQVERIASASARSPEAFELAQGLKGVYRHPNFIHDRELKTVQFKVKNKPVVTLLRTENMLLTGLEKIPNEFISDAKLDERVFGGGHSVGYVRRNVSLLRQKMESDPNTPRVIAIVDGGSYRLIDPSRSGNLENEVVHRYDRGRIIYYPDLFFVLVNGRRVGLAGIESELLGLLAKNSGEVVEHETIYRELWGDDVGLDILKAPLNNLIQRVRRKIRDRQDEDGNYFVIRSIHGEGYEMGHEDRPQLENLSTISL